MRNKALRDLVQLFTYKPSDNDTFVLEEKEKPEEVLSNSEQGFVLPKLIHNVEKLLQLNEKMIFLLDKAAGYLSEMKLEQMKTLKRELETVQNQFTDIKKEFVEHDFWQENIDSQLLSPSLEDNQTALKLAFKVPKNFGVNLRNIEVGSKSVKGLLVFMEGLVDKKQLDLAIMQPLLHLSAVEMETENIIEELLNKYLPCAQTAKITDFHLLQDAVNRGKAVLLFEGITEGIAIEAIGVEHRAGSEPQHEQSLRGSQSAFTELLNVNIGQIRSLIKTSDLIVQTTKVGT